MAISLEDVQRAAHLARIEIEPGEADAVLERLRAIFHMIEAMQAVPTRSEEHTSELQSH